jgi:hypothetical protein
MCVGALETELLRDAKRIAFVVRSDVPLYRDRLIKMGWSPSTGPGVFMRRLDTAPDVERNVLVPRLQLQLAVAERRNQADRAALIRRAMSE